MMVSFLMENKPCSKCKCTKPLSEFGYQKRGLFGKRSICKSCTNIYTQAYSKSRYETDPDFRVRKSLLASEWVKANPLKRSLIAVRRNKKESLVSPEKTRCRALVNQRVRFGRIPRASDLSCSQCGNPAKEYHHYNGYSWYHRYDVIPVCRKCHKSLDS